MEKIEDSEKVPNLPEKYFLYDRGFGNTNPSIDLMPNRDLNTIEFINYWIKFQESKSETTIKSEEWIAIEKAYSDHLIWRFDYPKKLFSYQLIHSIIVSTIVIALVGFGIYFSFFQLQQAMIISESSQNIIDLNLGNFSIRSSIIGASVLLISLLFFFLYLKFIYISKTQVPPHIPLSKTDAMTLFGIKKE